MYALIVLLACGEKSETDSAIEPVDTGSVSPEPEPEDVPEPEDTTDTTQAVPKNVSIEDIQQGIIAVGERVTLDEVIVSSPANNYGFYITTASGGPYSGMFVYYYFDEAVTLNIEQGDIISVTGEVWEYPDTCEDRQDNDGDGLTDEEDPDCEDGGQEEVQNNYQTMTELKLLDPGDINKIGETETDPSITIVDSSVLTTPETAEAYEGVLVRIENGTVTAELDEDGRWGIDNVMVDDLFGVQPGLVNEGDTFDIVQGILHFSSGSYKIVPRAATDLIGWDRTCMGERCIWDATEGEITISEIMVNPDNNGDCPDSQGEYVEVVYTSQHSDNLDLRGMLLSDQSNTEPVRQHVILNPGETAWISVGEQSCYGNANIQLGSTSFGLNNGGDTLTLHYTDIDGETVDFDSLVYTGDWVESGVSIQLSSDKINATDNDDRSNWCFATTTIANSTDLGTPGETNEICP
ncbi:MAG: lamin tail domain-containing protein [Myxococcota bacterium]|nr:lamin tail domain-containing protein [Myxococcota bacterium]